MAAFSGVKALCVAAVLSIFWAAAAVQPASAHSMPNSFATLDFGSESVRVQAILPWEELRYSLGAEEAAPERLNPPLAARLEAYARSHVGAQGPGGEAWSTKVERISLDRAHQHTDVLIDMVLTPPAGVTTDRFTLRDSAVIDVVKSHVTLIFARNDYVAGRLDEAPRLIGALQAPQTTIPVSRPGDDPRGSFMPALRLGAMHILQGADHLLFLFTLLLPAPLLAEAGRWRGARPARQAIVRLLAMVTAFTIGHSLTLILGAAFSLNVPERPVEMAIAFSILIAALAAWRPFVFEGRAGLGVAVGFGLIHGLAFSTSISEALLPPWEKAQAIAGFNLGIEAVQIVLVAAVAPLLIYLARRPAYRYLRVTGAAGAGVAALGWMAARSGVF